MPARYNPRISFEIGWGGSYSHRFSDVTELLQTYQITDGGRPALDGRGPRTAIASGQLVLSNRDRRFDPDSRRLQVPENDLRRRNPCRLLLDGVVDWEGLASYSNRIGADDSSLLTFKLEGKYTKELLLGRRKMDTGGGDCNSLAAHFTDVSGVPLSGGTDNPVGLVYYEGNWLVWLDNFGRYAGGWCLEDNRGNWKFIEFAETPNLPVAARLGLDFEPDNDSLTVGERVGWVRNYAECIGSYWARNERETLLASASRKVGRNFRFAARLRFSRNSHQQPLGWTRFDVSPPDIAFRLSSNIISATAADVVVQTLGYAAVPPQDVRVSGFGNSNSRTNTTPEKLSVTEFDTQDVYGQQQLRTPPWFPADFSNLGTYFKPWLRNLSQPVEAIRVTYDNRQVSQAMAHTLRDHVVSGNAIEVDIAHEGRVDRKPLLVMSTVRQGTMHGGRRTVYGVVRRSTPPAPLGVTTRLVTDRTAVVGANVQSPALENLYMRRRTA